MLLLEIIIKKRNLFVFSWKLYIYDSEILKDRDFVLFILLFLIFKLVVFKLKVVINYMRVILF